MWSSKHTINTPDNQLSCHMALLWMFLRSFLCFGVYFCHSLWGWAWPKNEKVNSFFFFLLIRQNLAETQDPEAYELKETSVIYTHTLTHSEGIKPKLPWCSMLHLHCIFSAPLRKHRPSSVSLSTALCLSLQPLFLYLAHSASALCFHASVNSRSPLGCAKKKKSQFILSIYFLLVLINQLPMTVDMFALLICASLTG